MDGRLGLRSVTGGIKGLVLAWWCGVGCLMVQSIKKRGSKPAGDEGPCCAHAALALPGRAAYGVRVQAPWGLWTGPNGVCVHWARHVCEVPGSLMLR